MKTFELTIIKESRALIAVFTSPLIAIATIIIKLKLDSFILAGLSLLIILYLVYYFLASDLTVTIDEGVINFEWTNKLFFNYQPIPPVAESDIEKVVVDKGEFLRKIITADRIIKLGTNKIWTKDSKQLISYFELQSKVSKLKIVDSWETIPKKRLLLFQRLNGIILVLAVGFFIFLLLFKGFQPKMLFLFLFCIPQVVSYGQQMKDAIKKSKK